MMRLWRSRARWFKLASIATAVGIAAIGLMGGMSFIDPNYVVIAYNDLGMHCMQQDFSQIMILPPYNTLHAQVIRRGTEPDIIETDARVSYVLPSNTHSSDKCNFWTYAPQLLGANLISDVGVTGNGLAGTMTYNAARRDHEAVGIPVTPVDDTGKENPYPLALVRATVGGQVVAQTQAVVPVSWEMSCNLCHNTPGISMATDILRKHDRLHNTTLEMHQPVLCASCHSDNALGAPGQPGVSSLSSAMHTAHASRMDQAGLQNSCYACHPGVRTNCQRDTHAVAGITCVNCHTSMEAVGNPSRRPWLDEPRCDSCHGRPGAEYEQPGTLFRNSVGHGGVQCMTCHGSPHAVGTARTPADNLQARRLQGHSGPLDSCTVCHTVQPTQSFFHRREN